MPSSPKGHCFNYSANHLSFSLPINYCTIEGFTSQSSQKWQISISWKAILHKSVHKGTELGGWIESPISMENFKQAGEAFDVLSYWGIAEREDFICDGRNYFCVSRISLVSLFRERAMRRKGWWLLLLSPFLCLPPTSEEAFRAAYHDGDVAAARFCVAGIKGVAVWWSWSLPGEDWRVYVRATGPSTALQGRFGFWFVWGFLSPVDCTTWSKSYNLGCLVCDRVVIVYCHL